MTPSNRLLIVAGALSSVAVAIAGAMITGEPLAARLQAQAEGAIGRAGGAPVRATFAGPFGLPSRHAILSGGGGLSEERRAAIARVVAAVPGVGGVHWADGSAMAESVAADYEPGHCQDEVGGLLRARSVRFEEGSAELASGSAVLLDEVADALRPCVGSIIAITGHTDASGTEAANVALSRERALAVRGALAARGIPARGMRARGVGSSLPVAGLDPADPANRRIEFSVLIKPRLVPSPVDTPGAR